MEAFTFRKSLSFAILFSLILLGSCSKDNPIKKSYIEFELAGPLMNGVFTIEEDSEVLIPLATGLLFPETDTEDETAILTYQNQDQDLSVVLVFPPKTGLIELLFDATHYISISDLENEVNLASKTVSLNILSFKKKGSPLPNGIGGTFEAKGSFNGIMIYVDSSTGEEFSHVLTGEFEYF